MNNIIRTKKHDDGHYVYQFSAASCRAVADYVLGHVCVSFCV